MKTNRLITIPISHYCEKARWALERAGIPYIEERHLQGFHTLPVYLAGKVDTAPVLVTGEGTFSDSTDIMKWADQKTPKNLKLYPSDPKQRQEVELLGSYFDGKFGAAGRLWMYTYLLSDTALILRYSKIHKVPAYQRLMFPIVSRFTRKYVAKALEMDSNSRAQSLKVVDRYFKEVGDILRDGRPFLVGDRFTAADLTFAALAAAVLIPDGPDEYGVRLPSLSELPTEMRDQVLIWRNQPAGIFALKMFHEHRTLPLLQK